ncbi:MAG: ABC transporter substrate-binding protein [Pseudomonadota bacterium]
MNSKPALNMTIRRPDAAWQWNCRSRVSSVDMVRPTRTVAVAAVALLLVGLPWLADARVSDVWYIGLEADMSSGTAEAGQAIKRGTELAIEEINAAGGLLGRSLKLLVRDNRGNPARGVDNILEYGAIEDVIAVMGGLHTPVLLPELPLLHEHALITLVPWAAGTAVVDNGYSPNFVFRVSVRDELAGGVMIEEGLRRGCSCFGLLLERTGWGRSNEQAIHASVSGHETAVVAGTNWFDWGAVDLIASVQDLYEKGADCLVLVANPREGKLAIDAASRYGLQKGITPVVLSHWGITGGGVRFYESVSHLLDQVDLSFIQSFSFFNPRYPEKAQRFFEKYASRYPNITGLKDIHSAPGTAQAYDLVHLLALAVTQAQTTDSESVLHALENLPPHDGLIKRYEPAFTSQRHDALGINSLEMYRYRGDGAIVPVR